MDGSWNEVHYYTDKHKPLGPKMKGFLIDTRSRSSLRIAAILFASDLFESCPSFEIVKSELGENEFIDFTTDENVPPHFKDLLEESKMVKIDERIAFFHAYPVSLFVDDK